ncbi:MAG TPA: M48 family metallopeptidase [Dongiaceae bacterium]|nr:M48 family metallopeptidase [Dongiaceae bacterium]
MRKLTVSVALATLLAGCAADGSFDTSAAMNVGAGVLQAATLSEDSVKQTASLAAQQMDTENQVPPASNAYSKRLAKITQGMTNIDGLNLNFKVYLSEEINAFAMADGTVRVYSGLLDAMPDDQVLGVIGHEVGHVKLKHSYQQMQQKLLTDSAFAAAVSVGGTVGTLTQSQLGQLGAAAVSAQFSQKDELEADQYAVTTLRKLGKDPAAMKRAIETLQTQYGSESSFLSSHPSNAKRIERIQAAIDSKK